MDILQARELRKWTYGSKQLVSQASWMAKEDHSMRSYVAIKKNMVSVEGECIQVISRGLEEATLNCENASPTYEMAFSENNPSLTWKDRTSDSSDLKEVFSKFDSSAPISTEILSRARFLCAKYLGGAWTRVQLDQFDLKAITGGTSNLLFLVELSDSVPVNGVEPNRALLRIQCQTDLDQLLSESVVFTLLSERVLGPKLLGVFPGGRFEQFIPSRALQCDEISKPMLARLIAPMLARVHTLDVPITKEPGLILCARGYLNKFRNTAGGSKPIDIRCTAAKVSCDQISHLICRTTK
uniref:Choline/ethanolamine kinase n=1 Tax=Heterorhabditis bacteriophora TaxID=37862 RepID=A0A1I7XKU9_HETBA